MPPRPPLPHDDLYARLGVPRDASSEAIDLAWRGLLRKHHPDVAGDGAVELAKRINVAHDWLSDPELRSRYDREHVDGIRVGRRPRAQGRADRPDTGWRAPRRPPTTAERVAAVIERVGRLTQDELDRLALAEPAPIAFLATLRRFVPPELDAVIDRAGRAGHGEPAARRPPRPRDPRCRLRPARRHRARRRPRGDPRGSGGTRARERLTRGWEAAVGQPRYGPATAAIGEMLERLRALSPDAGDPGRERRPGAAGDPALAAGDVAGRGRRAARVQRAGRERRAAAVDAIAGNGERQAAPARRAAARVAHLLVLRHAFPVREFDRHAAPWLGGADPPRRAVGTPRRPATRGGLSGLVRGRGSRADRRPALCAMLDPWTRGSPSPWAPPWSRSRRGHRDRSARPRPEPIAGHHPPPAIRRGPARRRHGAGSAEQASLLQAVDAGVLRIDPGLRVIAANATAHEPSGGRRARSSVDR